MANRYVNLLPPPGEDDAAERLNAYLAVEHAIVAMSNPSRRAA